MNNNSVPPINPILLNPQWIQFQKSLTQPQPLMNINAKLDQGTKDIDFSSRIIRFDQKTEDELIENYFGESINDLNTEYDQNLLDNVNIDIQTVDFNHGLSSAASTTIKMGNLLTTQKETPLPEPEPEQKRIQMPNLITSLPKKLPTKIEQLLLKPYRDSRHHKLVIILRGLPGSGKSFLANLIKQEEEKHVSSSDKPKFLSIDNYFISEQDSNTKSQVLMKYEYDEAMDDAYQKSLIKSFKKLVDDDLFNFILVDMINEKIAPIEEMSSHATLKGFQTYIADLNFVDDITCFNRNVHNRTLEDIKKIKSRWENLPDSYLTLDVSFFFNNEQEIEQVEMGDDSTIYDSAIIEKNDDSEQINKIKRLKS